MQNVKLILFDIDNTLVFGKEATLFYERYSRVLEERLASLLRISVTEARQIADDFRARFNGHGEKAYEELLGDISPWYESIMTISPQDYLTRLEIVNEFLLSLRQKGYVVGAVTDGPTKQAESILNFVGIDKNVFDLFMAWEPQKNRPKGGSSDVYLQIAQLYGLLPEQIVMVGDSLGTDILPAVTVGLQAIHISERVYPEATWLTVDSVLQLESIF